MVRTGDPARRRPGRLGPLRRPGRLGPLRRPGRLGPLRRPGRLGPLRPLGRLGPLRPLGRLGPLGRHRRGGRGRAAAPLLVAGLLLVTGCGTLAAHAAPPLARWATPGASAPASPSGSPSGAPSAAPRPSAQPLVTPDPPPGDRLDGAPRPLATLGFTFQVASGGTPVMGTGSKLLRYEVAVQSGLTETPAEVAATVDSVLGNPTRGWSRGGQWRFQRVSGGAYDFVVELATPSTTDAICAKYGIDTNGEVSCRAQKNVVLNLARWQRGTNGTTEGASSYPPEEYRIIAINHEVGHALGHQHATCPGPGAKAPVMQTQFYGLDGCVQNVWPYDVDGHYLD
jgi:hypothetical protein